MLDWSWRRRPGHNPHDRRIGPWRAADWTILDEAAYRADGEVLYLLSDAAGRVRYVGESKGRLRTRWRTPPLDQPNAHSSAPLFHNIAWQAIERSLIEDPATAPLCVSVIGVDTLTALVDGHSDIRAAVEAGSRTASGAKHLSWHVETWLLQQPSIQLHAWNVAKRRAPM